MQYLKEFQLHQRILLKYIEIEWYLFYSFFEAFCNITRN